jgi:hypothetical protein
LASSGPRKASNALPSMLYCETSGFLSSVKRIHSSTTNHSSSLSFLKGSLDSDRLSSITTVNATTLNSNNYIGSNQSYRRTS